jgi:hypothetical protein
LAALTAHIADAPPALLQFMQTRGKPRTKKADAVPVTIDQDRARAKAVEYLRTAPAAIEGSGGDHATFKVAAYLKDLGCSEELAVELMRDEWNERCSPPWDDDDLQVKVRNAYAYGVNAAGSAAAEAQFRPVETAAERLFADPPKRSLRMITLAEACADHGEQDYLIKGLLNRGGSSVMWGPPGASKTQVAHAIMWHVATGTPWCGRRVRQAPAVAFALEGGAGAARRFAAVRHEYGGEGDIPMILCPEPIAFRDPRDLRAAQDLLGEVRARYGQAVGLVVVDTWNRAMLGDENSSRDVAELLQALAVLQADGAHVNALHHPRKAGDSERGHTSIRGDTDATIEVNEGRLIFHKVRDGAIPDPIAFGSKIVTLGTDADGDPITAPVAVFGGAVDFGGPPVAGGMTEVVNKLCAYLVGRELTLRELETRHLARAGISSRQLRRALAMGKAQGRIRQFKDGRRQPYTVDSEGAE